MRGLMFGRVSFVLMLSAGILFAFGMLAQPILAQNGVTIAIPTDPDSFDPHQSVAAATGEIAFNMYEGLVRAGQDGSIKPALAKEWTVDETGTVYSFTLREAVFHNGSEVRPEDVQYSLDRLRDPERSQRASDYSAIKDVTTTDLGVIVELHRPHGPFLASLAEIAAAVIPSDHGDLSQQPVGTGPFQFVHWRPNQEIRLGRFEDHWAEELPFFEEVTFAIYPDDHSAILALKAGQVDVIPRLDPSLAHQVENDPQLEVISSPMNLVQLVAINHEHPAFSDRRVRQALAMALDRDELIAGAAWGRGTPLASGLSPAMAVYHAEGLDQVYKKDLDEARRLLTEAGYESLAFTLDLPAPYAIHVQTGEIAAQQWAAIGVEVKLNIIEWGTWLERVYSQRDYEATIVGLAGRLDPHAILVRYQSDSSRNFFNFKNADYDAIIDQALGADEEERIDLYNQAQRILTEEVAGLFIMDPEQLSVLRQGLHGWANYPVYVIDAASLHR